MDQDPAAPAPCHGQLIVHANAPASPDPGLASVVPADELAGRSASIAAQPPGPDANGMAGRRRDCQDGPWTNHDGLVVWTPSRACQPTLEQLPIEILLHVLGFLDVNDLLSTSRTSHLFRSLSLAPIIHHYRLRRTRYTLPPLLASPTRPSLADLMARSIFLTHTSVVSRRLARSLVSIRLSRRLAARPSAEALVERAVLPVECVPGMAPVHVAPAIVARRRAVEKERVKDGLRRWVAAKWRGEVREREEHVRRWEESRGVGRVWRLTRFWERVSKGEDLVAR
ncbi:Uncharacterized protein TPAR_00622 [Tolypocladium paradoxum]|uniref:F-box domain-containing protein n=1 Tax=Tolypocladium paradoxum TaxID=94208 RepID=A0A2S4L9T6_9HYPO|nr:Uncharacterized protein TPAR_00622 [Tolypocladium paradoxum]